MSKAETYRHLFTSQYLMGPNSIQLLDEMLAKYPLEKNLRILDLGCGKGLTSLFLVKETEAQVFATDLWISATENFEQFRQWGITDRAIPIHADANALPFADAYFDVIVSIDSFHYFAHQNHFFAEKILPLVKRGGRIILAIPGLKEEIHGCEPPLIREWLDGEENEFELFHSRAWWTELLSKSDGFEIVQSFDLDNFSIAWNDWFLSGHPFAKRDGEYFKKGVDQYLSVAGFVIERK